MINCSSPQTVKMPDAGDHRRNVEIKAKLADEKEFAEKVEIAKQLTGVTEATIIVQHDVFFNVPSGRLKLRYEVSCQRVNECSGRVQVEFR